MPNMDYPGPCMACSAVDGCASEEKKQKAVESYCKGLEMEVNSWKARLYDVLAEAGSNPPGDFKDTLNLIKSTIKELEAKADQMRNECPASMGEAEKDIAGKLENLRSSYTKALDQLSPGMIGG